VDEFYDGQAVILGFPIMPMPDYKDWFIPLEELPQEIRELYEYHPDKAKQLMKEAGYEDGFTMEVVIRPDMVDMLTLIKAYWAEINVDLIIDLQESGVFSAISAAFGYKDATYNFAYTHYAGQFPQLFDITLKRINYSRVDDPIINKNAAKVEEALLAYDDAEVSRLIKEITPYMLDQAYYIQPPITNLVYAGQPWVKRFTGINSPGFSLYFFDTRYLWIDQKMKKEMGY
jgi:peptide/nickel transport system substrate-binding protein